MSEGVLVEACVDSIESALAAVRGGAHGIELCANLVEGGTTPSAGTLAVCRERLDIPIHVLVRPRGGDFLYTAAEFTVMLEDIRRAKQAGAEGVVTGALRADGEIDTDRTRELIGAARPLRVTFHRAFDVCRDPGAAQRVRVECDRRGGDSAGGGRAGCSLIPSYARGASIISRTCASSSLAVQ